MYFEIRVSPVAIASERSLPALHGLCACVGMGLCRKADVLKGASGNQLYFVWRLFCGMRS